MSQMHTGLQFEQLEKNRRLIIRDDHYDLPVLADLLETAARRKDKVILLDTGRFAPEEFERLADFPFNLYTSDRARKDFQQLNQIFLRLEPAGSKLFYFLHGELENSQELGAGAEIFSSIYVSSREKPRSLETLGSLAAEISRQGCSLAYYHHGKLEENLAEIGQKNCWVHVSSKHFSEEDEILLLDMLKTFRKNRGRLVAHIERPVSSYLLKLLEKNGVFLVFNLPLLESGSEVSRLAKTWERKKLPETAFYLYKEVMA